MVTKVNRKNLINKLRVNPIWIYISMFIYVLIRIGEYTIGEKGTPEWVIDFFPYILPLLFVMLDNILGLNFGKLKSQITVSEKRLKTKAQM